jgi:DNA-binding SARP family transcriptional activator
VDFGILGPLQVRRGVDRVKVGGANQRAALAVLLIHANEVVSSDRLIDAIWADDAPADAAHALHVYVSVLRKVLEPDHLPGEAWRVVVTKAPGYAIELDPERFDRSRFERLASEGRRALSAGHHARAANALGAALALWRGEALADFTYQDFAAAEATRLNEQRLNVLEDRIDADLALGRHAALVEELRAAVHDNPTREGLWAQLMLALYRSGRQTDALHTYQELAHTLREEFGLNPNPELVRLEEAILLQKPELDWRPAGEHPSIPVDVTSADTGEPEGGEANLHDASSPPAAASPSESQGASTPPAAPGRARRTRLARLGLVTVAAAIGACVAVAVWLTLGWINSGGHAAHHPTDVTASPKPFPTNVRLGQLSEYDDGTTIRVYQYNRPDSTDNEAQPPKPGSEFAFADVEFCAGKKVGADYNADGFDVETSDGHRHHAGLAATIDAPDTARQPTLGGGDIPANGGCKRGWVTLEVPAGQHAASIVWDDPQYDETRWKLR